MVTVGWQVGPPTPGTAQYTLPDFFNLNETENQLLSTLITQQLDQSQAGSEATSPPQLCAALEQVCLQSGLLPSRESANRILQTALEYLQGYGPLNPLIADPQLEEIAVTGVQEPVWVYHRQQGWLCTNAVLTNAQAAVHLINKMARPLGRRVSYQYPRLNTTLPDGSRLHASIAPIAAKGVELTIRKFTPTPLSPVALIARQTLSARTLALLALALRTDHSLLVGGNTGSGKTSTLNALFGFVPLGERIVVTEETPEVRLPHSHVVQLVANAELGISLKDLAQDTLRMRPDRVVIGEARTPDEVHALLDATLAGQARGTYATFHADSAREALYRLQSLGARPPDLHALRLVLIQRRMSCPGSAQSTMREVRKVTELAEITPEGEARLLVTYKAIEQQWIEHAWSTSGILGRVAEGYQCTVPAALKRIDELAHWLEQTAQQHPEQSLADFARNVPS